MEASTEFKTVRKRGPNTQQFISTSPESTNTASGSDTNEYSTAAVGQREPLPPFSPRAEYSSSSSSHSTPVKSANSRSSYYKSQSNSSTSTPFHSPNKKDTETEKFLSTFKIYKCKEKTSHDKKVCPYWHSRVDRRRNPFEVAYSCVDCPHVDDNAICKDGEACLKCHSNLEKMFHPDLYKISTCTKGKACDRGKYCAFAHSPDELRTTPVSNSIAASALHSANKGTASSPNGNRSGGSYHNSGSGEQSSNAPYSPDFSDENVNAVVEKLVQLIKKHGSDGIISSELPRRYFDMFGERLELTHESGEKLRIKELLASKSYIVVRMHKGVQPKYVYCDDEARGGSPSSASEGDVDEDVNVAKVPATAIANHQGDHNEKIQLTSAFGDTETAKSTNSMGLPGNVPHPSPPSSLISKLAGSSLQSDPNDSSNSMSSLHTTSEGGNVGASGSGGSFGLYLGESNFTDASGSEFSVLGMGNSSHVRDNSLSGVIAVRNRPQTASTPPIGSNTASESIDSASNHRGWTSTVGGMGLNFKPNATADSAMAGSNNNSLLFGLGSAVSGLYGSQGGGFPAMNNIMNNSNNSFNDQNYGNLTNQQQYPQQHMQQGSNFEDLRGFASNTSVINSLMVPQSMNATNITNSNGAQTSLTPDPSQMYALCNALRVNMVLLQNELLQKSRDFELQGEELRRVMLHLVQSQEMQQRSNSAKEQALLELQRGRGDLEAAQKEVKSKESEVQSLKEALHEYRLLVKSQEFHKFHHAQTQANSDIDALMNRIIVTEQELMVAKSQTDEANRMRMEMQYQLQMFQSREVSGLMH